jgi:hypothetical protein
MMVASGSKVGAEGAWLEGLQRNGSSGSSNVAWRQVCCSRTSTLQRLLHGGESPRRSLKRFFVCFRVNRCAHGLLRLTCCASLAAPHALQSSLVQIAHGAPREQRTIDCWSKGVHTAVDLTGSRFAITMAEATLLSATAPCIICSSFPTREC